MVFSTRPKQRFKNALLIFYQIPGNSNKTMTVFFKFSTHQMVDPKRMTRNLILVEIFFICVYSFIGGAIDAEVCRDYE